ncbi:MAG: response regulator [Balneolaceae bacterium]
MLVTFLVILVSLLLLFGIYLILQQNKLKREIEKQQEEHLASMNAISGYTQSALLVVDRTETIRFFNQKFIELFEMTDAELIGKKLSETDLPSDLIEAFHSKSEFCTFTDIRDRSRERQLYLQPVRTKMGVHVGALLQINLEVHERNTQPFDPIAIKLEKVSHKLKTPLNSIMGYCEVLLTDSELNEKQLDYLQTIADNGGRLLDQIESILNDREESQRPGLRLVNNRENIRKILIVDDVTTNRTLLRIMLERHGFELIEAQNGKEAVEKVLSESPDLILMDIMMPVMDGIEAIEMIRKPENNLTELPIIAVTAINRRGNRERILNAGFNGYLQKPFKEQDLMALIGS